MPRVDKYQRFRAFLESPEFGEASARDALVAFEASLSDKTKERRRTASKKGNKIRWSPKGPLGMSTNSGTLSQRAPGESQRAPGDDAILHIVPAQQVTASSDVNLSQRAPGDQSEYHENGIPTQVPQNESSTAEPDVLYPKGPLGRNDTIGQVCDERSEERTSPSKQGPSTPTPPPTSPSSSPPTEAGQGSLFDGVPGQEPEPQLPKPKGVKSPLNAAEERIFRLFWKDYPRKTHKRTAQFSFHRALTKVHWEVIRVALAKAAPIWADGYEQQYIPEPATWLNQHRWEEEPVPRTPDDAPLENRYTEKEYSDYDTPEFEAAPTAKPPTILDPADPINRLAASKAL